MRPSSWGWYGESRCGYLLAIGEGVWAAFLLEGFMESGLHLHPLADIVDDPDGQPLGCHKLHCPHTCQDSLLQSVSVPSSLRRIHKFEIKIMEGGGGGGWAWKMAGGGDEQKCGHAVEER